MATIEHVTNTPAPAYLLRQHSTAIRAEDDGSSQADLSALLVDATRIRRVLQQITDRVADTLSARTSCTMVVQRDGPPRTVAGTGSLVPLVDEIQYDTDNCPALTALRHQETCYLPDLTIERRWPVFSWRARNSGVMAVLSLPLSCPEEMAASLNLYSTAVHPYPTAKRRVIELFVPVAETALSLGACGGTENLADDLREALRTQATIDRAIGAVMADNACGADEAFALLRDAATYHNLTLTEVATHRLCTLA